MRALTLRRREPGVADEAEQPLLRFRARECRFGVALEQGTQSARSAPAVQAVNGRGDGGGRGEPARKCLIEGALEFTVGHLFGQVDECPRHRRHRNAAHDPLVLGVEYTRAMNAQAGAPPVRARDRDVDHIVDRIDQAPDRAGGGAMAHDGTLSARKHGGQLPGQGSERRVTDCVDAPMKRMKPTSADPCGDRAVTDARGKQLRSRHHAVLPRGDVGNQRIAPRASSHRRAINNRAHVPAFRDRVEFAIEFSHEVVHPSRRSKGG
jgi:hypothetical protein